jgi:hypothetical protein
MDHTSGPINATVAPNVARAMESTDHRRFDDIPNG